MSGTSSSINGSLTNYFCHLTIRGIYEEIPPKKVPKIFIFFTNSTIRDYVSNYSNYFIHYCLLVFTSLYFSRIYLYRLAAVGKNSILHRHQCKTCGIIYECESGLGCNPSIFMNHICVTCRNYWNTLR